MGEKLISLSKKISFLMKNPRHQKKWQGIAGVAFIICFVLFTVVFDGSNIALALKNTSYGYGYGYGATEIIETSTAGYYGYGYQMSDYPPAALGSFVYQVGSTSATFSWTYPTLTTGSTTLNNPSGVCYKADSTAAITSADTLGACNATGYTSVAYGTTTATVTGLTAGTTYYYAFQAYDDNYAYGTATYGSFTTGGTTTTSSGGGGSAAGGQGAPTSAEPAVTTTPPVTGVTAETAVPKLPAVRDLDKEKAAIIEMRDYLGFLPSTDADWKMIQYIAYGAGSGSAKLTARERRGVLGDYNDTYGYYPTKDAHWIDIELILTSHKPKGRNLDKERWAITEFQKIYKRLPVWSTVGDDWAVTYIAYKVRNVTRNLASEKAGIASFKSVYKKNPSTSQDWATVRAITYTGAKR